MSLPVPEGPVPTSRGFRTDRPAPGFVNVFALGSWAGVEAVFFGPEGAAVADRERPAWQACVAGHLPDEGDA